MQKKFAAAKRATMTNARQQTQGSKPARFIELTCGPNMPSTITASAMMNRTVCRKRRVDRARRKGPRRGRDNKSKWPAGVAEAVFGGNNFHSLRKTRAKREFRTGSERTSTLRFDWTFCGRTRGLLDERYLI